jgi:hypothetical protein
MSVVIRAHFDGKTIVSDGQVDLPADEPLEVVISVLPAASAQPPSDEAGGKASITSLPFFGMWADRKDMTDSGAWVRNARTSSA